MSALRPVHKCRFDIRYLTNTDGFFYVLIYALEIKGHTPAVIQNVVCVDEAHQKSFAAHFLPRWRLVKTELPVREREKQLVWARLSSPALCPGRQSLPLFPAAVEVEQGDVGLLLPADLLRSASEARAKPPRSQRTVPFSAKVRESLFFRGRRQLVRLLSLYALQLQRELWDIRGNPTEFEGDSVKTKSSVRTITHNHFHTLSYLLKVFAVTYSMDEWGGKRVETHRRKSVFTSV